LGGGSLPAEAEVVGGTNLILVADELNSNQNRGCVSVHCKPKTTAEPRDLIQSKTQDCTDCCGTVGGNT
jgi:hypothetical protein